MLKKNVYTAKEMVYSTVSQEMFTKSLEVYSVLRNFARVEDMLTCLQQGFQSCRLRRARTALTQQRGMRAGAARSGSGRTLWRAAQRAVKSGGCPEQVVLIIVQTTHTMSLNRSDVEGLVMWDVIIGLSIHLT
jgi:hypothetical protein